jgi:hypothetical protein
MKFVVLSVAICGNWLLGWECFVEEKFWVAGSHASLPKRDVLLAMMTNPHICAVHDRQRAAMPHLSGEHNGPRLTQVVVARHFRHCRLMSLRAIGLAVTQLFCACADAQLRSVSRSWPISVQRLCQAYSRFNKINIDCSPRPSAGSSIVVCLKLKRQAYDEQHAVCAQHYAVNFPARRTHGSW